MNTAPGACLLYAPGAACFSNMVLEHYKSRGQNLKKAVF